VDGDEFYLIRMNAQPEPRRYDVPAGVDVLIREMQQQRVPDGLTPYDGCAEAARAVKCIRAEEKWLVVITDGNFEQASTGAGTGASQSIRETMGIRTIFLQIEAPRRLQRPVCGGRRRVRR